MAGINDFARFTLLWAPVPVADKSSTSTRSNASTSSSVGTAFSGSAGLGRFGEIGEVLPFHIAHFILPALLPNDNFILSLRKREGEISLLKKRFPIVAKNIRRGDYRPNVVKLT